MAKEQKRLTAKKKKQIVADYVMLGSYRAAARKHGVAPNTVKKLVTADGEFAQTVTDAKNAQARDILSYMEGQRDAVCTVIGHALEVLSSKEKMEEASPSQIATAMGILIDKWAMLEGKGGTRVEIVMGDKTEELAQ